MAARYKTVCAHVDQEYNILELIKTNNYVIEMPLWSRANIKSIKRITDGKSVKRAVRGIDMCIETQEVLDDYYFFFGRFTRFIRLCPIESRKNQIIIVHKKSPFPNDGTRKVDPEGWEKEFGGDKIKKIF